MNTNHRLALEAMRQTLSTCRRRTASLPRPQPTTAAEALARIDHRPRPAARPVGFLRPKQAADGGVVLAGRRAG